MSGNVIFSQGEKLKEGRREDSLDNTAVNYGVKEWEQMGKASSGTLW